MERLRAQSAEVRAVTVDGCYGGYVGLIPTAPGFALLSLYLTPAARAGGRGWSFCRDLTSFCAARSVELGLHAVVVQPTRPAQIRLCQMLGLEHAAELPLRGPVFIVCRATDHGRVLPACRIARLALPDAFAAEAALASMRSSLGLAPMVPRQVQVFSGSGSGDDPASATPS